MEDKNQNMSKSQMRRIAIQKAAKKEKEKKKDEKGQVEKK